MFVVSGYDLARKVGNALKRSKELNTYLTLPSAFEMLIYIMNI